MPGLHPLGGAFLKPLELQLLSMTLFLLSLLLHSRKTVFTLDDIDVMIQRAMLAGLTDFKKESSVLSPKTSTE